MPDPINVLIALPEQIPDELLARARAVSPRLSLAARTAGSFDDVKRELAAAEVLFTTFRMPTVEQAPRLRWVQTFSAGVDSWMPSAAGRLHAVAMTTASGVHAPNMAEYSLMMMLAFAHRQPEMWALQARHEWPDERWSTWRPGELRGATLGILGYGSIGRETARQARALGLRVLACKRDLSHLQDQGWTEPGTGDPNGALPERYYTLDQLDQLLPECDYLLLALALTPKTRHSVDAAALARMKPTAVLVNVARGGLVDEPALVEALRSGAIRGAGLDVFEKEPLPADSPLWGLPNAILTPHIAGISPALHDRLMALFSENLRRYVAGEPLLNRVDPAEGY